MNHLHCKLNEEFFDSQTPTSAYVLGWIYSDGTLRKNRYQIKIVSNDIEVLEKIKNLMSTNHKIYKTLRKNRSKPTYSLVLDSKHLYQQLIKIGLTPNKSKTLSFPILLQKVMPYFIRGYFEGDGCIWHDNFPIKGKLFKRIRASFTSGSYSMLLGLREFLVKKIGLSNCKIRTQHINHGYDISWSNKDTQKLFKYIYKDNLDMCLKRKYEKFNLYNQFTRNK